MPILGTSGRGVREHLRGSGILCIYCRTTTRAMHLERMPRMNEKRHTKSFLRGFARALDLRGALAAPYARRAYSRHRSDRAALAADWRAVMNDLGNAFSQVKLRDTATAEAHGTEAEGR